MLEAIKMAGWTGWLLVLLGFVGALASVACVVVAAVKRDALVAYWMAAMSMIFAFASFGLGIVGLAIGRHKVHRALGFGGLGPSIDPSQLESILYEGYLESRYNVRIGLVAGALPFVLGLVAFVLGLSKPKRGGVAIPITATFFAIATAAACFLANAQTLPGHDFRFAENGERDLYDAHGLLASGVDDRGCEKLARGIRDRREFRATFEAGTTRTSPVPDLTDILKIAPDFVALANRCAERLTTGIERDKDPALNTKRFSDFRSIEPAIDLDARARFRARIEGAFATGAPSPSGIGLGDIFGPPLGSGQSDGPSKAAPKIRQGATTVNGRLPPEVIQRIVRQNFGRFRLCYEAGLKPSPKLTGKITVRFVIARDGSVASAAADPGGTDIPDASVRDCVVRAFKSLSFPEPEGGVVTVVYPLMFSPGE
jgi:hypothetical protein